MSTAAATFAVHDGVVYFTNDSDQRVYAHRPGEAPTPSDTRRRTSDTPTSRSTVGTTASCACARTIHSPTQSRPTPSSASTLPAAGPMTIAQGNDFYSSPRSQSRTATGYAGWRGTTRTCPGTKRSCGWPTLTPTASPAKRTTRSWGRRRVHRRATVVAGWDAVLRLRPDGVVEPLPLGRRQFRRRISVRWRRSSRGRSGSSGPRTTGSQEPTTSSAPTRRTASGASVDSTLVPATWSRSISRSRIWREGH